MWKLWNRYEKSILKRQLDYIITKEKMKKYQIINNCWWRCFTWTLEECEKQYKEEDKKSWKIKELFDNSIWELIWEWWYRKVYLDKNSDYWVIKIAKDSFWEQMNKWEFEQHIEQQSFIRRWVNIPEQIAKCYFDSKTKHLYMEKLTPLKWSKNLWLNKDWICKTFDLF